MKKAWTPRRSGRGTKTLGLRCGKCKTFIAADVWALAHANIELKTKCPKCGAEVAGRIR